MQLIFKYSWNIPQNYHIHVLSYQENYGKILKRIQTTLQIRLQNCVSQYFVINHIYIYIYAQTYKHTYTHPIASVPLQTPNTLPNNDLHDILFGKKERQRPPLKIRKGGYMCVYI
jgi:hypothetical protein